MPEPVRVGIVSGVAAGIVLAIFLLSGAMHPVDLLFPGGRSAGADLVVQDFGPEAVPDRFSYDGQEMYVIAREFPDVESARGEGIGQFRIRRVLQPLMVWPLPRGDATVLALALTNVLGLALAAGALADLSARHGRDARLGYAACAALAFPLVITTTEPLAFGLGLLGLALADRRRFTLAILAFALAGLGRETALVMALAAGLATRLTTAQRGAWRAALAVALVPITVLVAWMLWLSQAVSSDTLRSTALFGFLDLPKLSPLDVTLCTATIALILVAVWRWRDVPLLALTALGYLGCCAFYIGDQFQWHGLPRVSAVGVALGLAGLVPRSPTHDEAIALDRPTERDPAVGGQ